MLVCQYMPIVHVDDEKLAGFVVEVNLHMCLSCLVCVLPAVCEEFLYS